MCSGNPKLPILEKERETQKNLPFETNKIEMHTRLYQEGQFQRPGTGSDYSSSYCNGSVESMVRPRVTGNHPGKSSLIVVEVWNKGGA